MAQPTMNKILTVGGLGFLALVVIRQLMRKGEAIKNLNVNVSKVDFNRAEKTFVIFVRCINPSNAAVTIRSIVGDVFWNGTTAATLDFRNETKIGPGEERVLQIPVKMNLTLLSLVTDLLTKKLKDVVNGKFEVKAVVNAEGLVVPFTYSQDIRFGV